MKVEFNQGNSSSFPSAQKAPTSFKGPLDGALTKTLMTIDTNQMINSTLIDLFSMVIPRTYIDTKERNKFAGFETFFREITGTVIMCLSSGVVSLGLANVFNKVVDKQTSINPNIWATNDTFDLLKHSWNKSDKNVEKYVQNVISNLSGLDGKQSASWKKIDWQKVQWFDNPGWDNIKWRNPKWANLKNETKTEQQIINALSDLIKDKNAQRYDVKKASEIIEHRIANALNVSKSVDVSLDDKKLSATLKNIIRDTYDLGAGIFTDNKINLKKAEVKLKSMNRFKNLGSIGIVALIGLTNQYINRQITKKRTGKDHFVGDQNFEKSEHKTEQPTPKQEQNKTRLNILKALAGAGIFTLSMGVMKIKSPAQFIKKLEFTGPITSGNAIKTLYTATLIGRFVASRDETELRESVTRDYLGFLNWLVLGGFVSKGVAQLAFDRKQNSLFNVQNSTAKGIGHWLNDVSEKSHAEIASKGVEFAKKNIWKHNVAQVSGLLYSCLALGFALPLLNIIITKNQTKKGAKSELPAEKRVLPSIPTNAASPISSLELFNDLVKKRSSN